MSSRRLSRRRRSSPRRSPRAQPSRRPRPRRTPSRLQSRSPRPRPSRRPAERRAAPRPRALRAARAGGPRRWPTAAEERASAAASTTVTIKDFEFTPAKITVNVGDTVTWKNDGPTAHSATADDGSFDTGIYGKGQSRSHTFDAAGTFAYICTPHPFMKGTVTVEAASTGGGGADADGGAENARGGASGDSGGGTSSSGSDTGSGSSLPATGSDTARLLAFGLLLLALGVAVRRRASAG